MANANKIAPVVLIPFLGSFLTIGGNSAKIYVERPEWDLGVKQ